ncbi:hypothetical protein ACTFIU_005725 [Dictyostelium citrinum]
MDNETLFFKIIKNVYLFKKILSFLNTTNKYQKYYKENNSEDKIQESIQEINLIKVRKYENIISVDWMIKNKHFYLLKWKLNDSNSNIKYSNKSIEMFCMNFSDSFPLELFIDIYSKISHFFIDESNSTLFHFSILNRIDIVKYLIINQSQHFKININNLSVARNLDLFKFLFNHVETSDEDEYKEIKLGYLKKMLPTISSQTNYSKEFIEYALSIYKGYMDENGNNHTMDLGDSVFNIIVNIGDYRLFLEYLVPIGYYSLELFSKLFYKMLYKLKENQLNNSISLDQLLILEYLRIQIITEQLSSPSSSSSQEGNSIYIDTTITNSQQFFIEQNYKEFSNKQNKSLESELLDDNRQPIQKKINEFSLDKKKLFQFFITYFKESIISIIMATGSNTQQLSLLSSLKSYLQMAIDLEDLESLKFLIALFNTNRLSLHHNLYVECLKYILNNQNNITFITNFSKDAKDILSFLLENYPLFIGRIHIAMILRTSNIKLLSYISSSKFTFALEEKINSGLLASAINLSSSISFIKYIYYDLNCIDIQKGSTSTNATELYVNSHPDNHDLFEIIKFVNETIIKPQPFKIRFESLLLNKLINHQDGLEICKYLLGGDGDDHNKQNLLSNISLLVSTLSNASRLDMLEYILSVYPTICKDLKSTHKTECFLTSYWETTENDDVIRYLFSKNQGKIPYIDYEAMIKSNNINLYKLSTQCRYLPSKQVIWSSISVGHLNMTLFLVNDYIDRKNLKNNEVIKFLFQCIENAIISRVLKLTQILVSMINDHLKKEIPQSTLLDTRSLLGNSVNSKDFEIFKYIIETFNLKSSDITIKNNKLTKSMLNYLNR